MIIIIITKIMIMTLIMNTIIMIELKTIIKTMIARYKYKKTFKDIISSDAIKKMRATKAGFKNWEEYVEKYPKKQFYKREVWRYTYQNPLDTLDNWDKRGKCGVEGAYQLDHIVSINEGWSNKILAEEIAK